MKDIIVPGVDTEAFLKRAIVDGYSTQNPFIDPAIGSLISTELATNGFLIDYTELIPTTILALKNMRMAHLLHTAVDQTIAKIEGSDTDHLDFFSVRVFEPGLHGTTVHRNHSSVGPWAVGITLKGEAPFNVYSHNQLPDGLTIPLEGDESDPVPLDTMNACAGSAWTLYTANQLVPHSSGIVNSEEQRELLLFYSLDNY